MNYNFSNMDDINRFNNLDNLLNNVNNNDVKFDFEIKQYDDVPVNSNMFNDCDFENLLFYTIVFILVTYLLYRFYRYLILLFF